MGDFVLKDPRGLNVWVPESTFHHAEKHGIDLGGNIINKVVETITSPDKVIANPSSFRNPTRTGQEQYQKFDETLNKYILAPVQILEEPRVVKGYGQISVGSRMLLSIYVKQDEPVEKVLWLKQK